jgi:hypothetical protein
VPNICFSVLTLVHISFLFSVLCVFRLFQEKLMVIQLMKKFSAFVETFYPKLNLARVRECTILTERPPLVGEVSANFCR